MFLFMIIILNIVLLILQLKISEQPFTYLPRPGAVHFSALSVQTKSLSHIWFHSSWREGNGVGRVKVVRSQMGGTGFAGGSGFPLCSRAGGGIAQDSRIQYQQRTQFIHLTIHHQTLHHLHQQRERAVRWYWNLKVTLSSLGHNDPAPDSVQVKFLWSDCIVSHLNLNTNTLYI